MEIICHKIAKIISRNLDTENILKPEQNTCVEASSLNSVASVHLVEGA